MPDASSVVIDPFMTGPHLAVTVQVGAPRKTRGHDDYFCRYRVTGLGDDESRAAYGVTAELLREDGLDGVLEPAPGGASAAP